jgi:hypothetical protein
VFCDSKRVLERNEDIIRYPSDKLDTATILNVNGRNNLEWHYFRTSLGKAMHSVCFEPY